MKSVLRKAAALGLVFAMGCTALSGCGGNGSKIDGTKTLMTVNGEDVRLGVGSFFAKYEQASIYQIYNMYFGYTEIFDEVHDHDEDGESEHTYGDEMKESVLSDLQKMMVIRQHAEEYGVSLTDEQTAAIEAAAQAYIDGNDKAILDKIGAEKEDVVTLMTLQTIQAEMMDPIVKDVDTDISDEEAQQTSVSYVRIDVAEEEEETEESAAESAAESEAASEAESAAESETSSEAESKAESEAASEAESKAESEAASEAESKAESEAASEAESAAESEAASEAESAAESEAASEAETASESEAAESEETAEETTEEAESEETAEETAEETEAQAAARELAEAVLAAVLEEEDIAEADLDAAAKRVDENYYSQTGQYKTSDPTDTSLDANLVAATEGLSDGELVDHVVAGTDGNSYYVVRLDHVFDEDATESEKKSILTERKQTLYDETVDGWVEEAEITVDEKLWAQVKLTDTDPITLKAAEAESEAEADTEAAAESVTESAAESEAASAAESAAESETASAAESTVESEAASEAESAAESEAASAAESAAESETASAAESAAESETASAAESAAESETSSAAESTAK